MNNALEQLALCESIQISFGKGNNNCGGYVHCPFDNIFVCPDPILGGPAYWEVPTSATDLLYGSPGWWDKQEGIVQEHNIQAKIAQ